MHSYSTLTAPEVKRSPVKTLLRNLVLTVGMVGWVALFASVANFGSAAPSTTNNSVSAIGGSSYEGKHEATPTILTLEQNDITVNGVTYPRYEIKGDGPNWKTISGQTVLDVPEGEDFHVMYRNHLEDSQSIIHAHGLTPPNALDGVPYLSRLPMESRRESLYRYDLADHNEGTYFLHSHFGLQHEKGMAVPLIVRGDTPKHYPLRKELEGAGDILMNLEDFCGTATDDPSLNPSCFNPKEVYDFLSRNWEEDKDSFDFDECMEPTTGSDVTYAAHLVNQKTLDEPVVQYVKPGQFYRVRIVDNGGMTNYELRFPENTNSQLISTDGQWAVPYANTNFYIGVAQRLDILIQIPEDAKSGDVLPIFAVAEMLKDQGGIVLVVEDDSETIMRGRRVSHAGRRMESKFPFGPKSDTIGRRELNHEQEMATSAFFPLAKREADVEFAVNLTGDNGFSGINKVSYQLPPVVDTYYENPNALEVKYGQRVCIEYKNFNADAHAMHLHGTSFQVVELDGVAVNGAMRDTLLMPPGACRTAKICFDATNPGEWPLHCHMSYHLSAGMLTTVRYVN